MEEDTASPGSATGANRRRVLGKAIGAMGEVLLTLGIVVGLFVVWELWWTDIIGTRHQRDIVENLGWEIPAIPVLIGDDLATALDGLSAYPIIPFDQMEFESTPPVEEIPGNEESFAAIYVPRWGENYVRPISEGVGRRSVLDRLGIGHYPGTALPGGWGNFAVAGHRTTFGKPFDRIEELVIGDAIVVRTESAWYVYLVVEVHIVWPSFSAAIAPVPGDESAEADGRYITLTTCHPRLSARQRYVVYGILDYWAPASAGYPPEIVPSRSQALEGAGGISIGAVN